MPRYLCKRDMEVRRKTECVFSGTVLSGCIGALLGAVLIGININMQDLDALGPTIALMLLPLLYGYIVKALIRLCFFLDCENSNYLPDPLEVNLVPVSSRYPNPDKNSIFPLA